MSNNTIKLPVKLAAAPPPTNPSEPRTGLGKIRMSPLMYGSLRYISSLHRNGTISIDEVRQLKQTQINSFVKNKWIAETPDRTGIYITEKGKKDLRSFTTNDEFFRSAVNMSFSSLLNLRLPGEPERVRRKSAQRGAALEQSTRRVQRAS